LNKRRSFTHQFLLYSALAAFFLLSACTNSVQPSTKNEVESQKASVTAIGDSLITTQSPDLGSPSSPDESTREAALENSRKPGPTLPPGDVSQNTELPKAAATTDARVAQADNGNISTPGQSTLDDTQATLSPDQLATRDAALENSSKPGPTPQAETTRSITNCLRGAGLILLPLAALAIHWRKNK
jgi:hypothetical protein